VIKSRYAHTGRISAVKEFWPLRPGEVGSEFTTEVESMQKVRHAYMMGLTGVVMPYESHNAAILTEWMSNGSLESLKREPDNSARPTPGEKVKVVIGICEGWIISRHVAVCTIARSQATSCWTRIITFTSLTLECATS
jgi:hypothetical protein